MPAAPIHLVFTEDAIFAEGVPANFKGAIPTCQVSPLVKYVEFSAARRWFCHCTPGDLGDDPGFLVLGMFGHPLDWLGRIGDKPRRLADALPPLGPLLDAHKGLRLLLDYSWEAGFVTGLFDLVDELVGELGVDPARVVLLVSNPAIRRRYQAHLHRHRRHPPHALRVLGLDLFLLYSAVEFERRRWFGQSDSLVSQAEIEARRHALRRYKFASLNRRPRWHRFILALMLAELGLDREGLVSMSSHDYRGDWWPEAAQIGEFGARMPPPLWDRLRALEPLVYASLPWVIDVNMDRSAHTSHYAYANIRRDVFLDSYVHVVTESYMEAGPLEVFVTEKLCKAIANLQPFVVFGTAGTLARLQHLGFQPPSMLDRAYDTQPDIGARLASLHVTLAGLRSLSLRDVHDRYHAELPALLANRHRLFQMPQTLGRLLAVRLEELTEADPAP